MGKAKGDNTGVPLEVTTARQQQEPDDPFAASNFAAAAAITADAGAQKVLLSIPVRKPGKLEWFRASADPEHNLRARFIEDRASRATFLVTDRVAALQGIAELTVLRDLTLCVDRAGNYFYWPVPVPSESTSELRWHTSARQALATATTRWSRVTPNMSAGAYDVTVAGALTHEPVWPDLTRSALLKLAFGTDRVIADASHTFVRQLLGVE